MGWMFDNVGQIVVPINGKDPDDVSLIAIDAGAMDAHPDEEVLKIFTQRFRISQGPGNAHRVRTDGENPPRS